MNPVKMQAQGLSLVELMIAMLLASMISAAAISMLVTDSQTSRFQINHTTSHNSGRFAFDFILADLRKAGYKENVTITTPSVTGLNSDNANISDELIIRYDASLVGNIDCVGNPIVIIDPAQNVVTNEYKVVLIDGESVLTCNDQPLMAGVEGFQVLFGIDNDYNNAPERYVRPGTGQANDNVSVVQIAMLVATREQGGETVPRSYQLLDVNTGEITDARGRTLFTVTERIRNINLDAVL